MKKVTFAFILVLFVSVSVIFGLAGDHSANKPPSFAADWPEGLSELLNRDEYAGGFFINASDWFFFRGDTSSLNRFLADYSKLKDTPLTVVLHAGRSGKVKSWPQKNIARDWQVAVINRKWISDGPKTRPSDECVVVSRYKVTVHVWLGGGVELDKIVVPQNVNVKSGGEIDRFISRHKARQATSRPAVKKSATSDSALRKEKALRTESEQEMQKLAK